MSKLELFHIGQVTFWQINEATWFLRYRDPRTWKDAKVRIKARNYDDARDIAGEHDKYFRGLLDTRPDKQAKHSKLISQIEVKAAMDEAEEMKVSHRRERSLLNYRNDAKLFQVYLTENHNLPFWKQLKTSEVFGYIQHMRKRGCSENRIRLALEPVRITSNYWAKKEKKLFEDFYAEANVKLNKTWVNPVALEIDQAADFLEFLQSKFPAIYPMALLTIATGLRQYEAAWIRPCDIDQKNRIITPADNVFHQLKTKDSCLPIPYPEWALSAVKVWPMDETQPLFLNSSGEPWSVNKLSWTWGQVIKQAREAKVVSAEFTAKNLRSTVATQAVLAGVPELFVQRLLRHAPASVLRKHYAAIKVDDLRERLDCFWILKVGIKRTPSNIKGSEASI